MARLRSPEKRSAILQAAVEEIAETGLGAATAKIAQRAGIASGTLFTYFASKEDLFNELYLELKSEIYARMTADFPQKGSLERKARHIWLAFCQWALDCPKKRKVVLQLGVSDIIFPETRAKASEAARSTISPTMADLDKRAKLRGLPEGFPAAVISAMQESVTELIAKHPKRREDLIARTFEALWRAIF
jgi:AcrR family transcriptional regulator